MYFGFLLAYVRLDAGPATACFHGGGLEERPGVAGPSAQDELLEAQVKPPVADQRP